jgi:helicase
MKRLSAGCTGTPAAVTETPEPGGLDQRWSMILQRLLQGRAMRPVQHTAIVDARILESRQHLIVCSPTNSGKSLLGHLVLLDAVLRGKRAVLLEPLRALAQEQADELSEALQLLVPDALERVPKVRLSTGDYRQDGELATDAPPEGGELIVATPERLDAILRNPANATWAASIGTLVIDEAHLIADPRRGPTLELVAASMLSLPVPARVVLLSATVGEPEHLRVWLQPCQLVTSGARSPLLKEVWQLDETEDPDDVLEVELQAVLEAPSTAAIVYVYRRDAADALARRLSESLGQAVLAYHSGQAAAQRTRIRREFVNGASRCLVATTALAMGVNLPATHVFVRDSTFHGHGKLGVDQLLQILGRAGRGDRSGLGVVILRPRDAWSGDELAQALHDEDLPPLRSSFEAMLHRSTRAREDESDPAEAAAASLVASLLGRATEDGLTREDLEILLGNTLGARSLVPRVDASLQWLTDPPRVLAHRDDARRWHLTALGRAAVHSMLPLTYAGGLGQLTRDLVSLDPTARLIGRWSALDHLFVISLGSDRSPKPRRFSEQLASRVDSWLESRPIDEKSFLFMEWVMGSASASRADELFGSLGIGEPRPGSAALGAARKRAYVAMLGAIILDERSRGVSVSDIETRWDVAGLEGTEEAWRDSAIWMLAGHTKVFTLPPFYHHLRGHCSLSSDEVRVVKRVFGHMQTQVFDLLERLKYCSPLGPLMRGVRDMLRMNDDPTLGIGTIRKLEAAGIVEMKQVAKMDVDALVNMGVQKRFAKQIHKYIRRRMR